MEIRGYNLSKLEPEATHYVAVGFSAPYCFHLPDDNYKVSLLRGGQKINYQVMVAERRRNINRGGLLPGAQDVEKFADRRGIYYYSALLVYIPLSSDTVRAHQGIDNLWRHVERNHPTYREQAVEATNRLIGIYRYVTGECHVRQLTGHDVWFDYSLALISVNKPSESYFMPVYDLHDIVAKLPSIPDAVTRDIREKAGTDFRTPLAEELMLNAYDWLDQGNYRMAVIEAETAFETAILSFLHEHYQDRPSVREQIDELTSFGRLINKDIVKNALASKGRDFSEGSSYRVEWDKSVWQVRGDLVHGRLEDATPGEASKAIQVVEKTLEYLLGRRPTNPWRFTE